MQKLKNSVLNTMLQSHMTKAEVDFMLELSHFQDDFGCVYGVYYKNVCEAIGVCPDTFYVTMSSLEAKGLIERRQKWYGDWDIVIVNNDFSYEEAFKEGYIDTGLAIFHNQTFKDLKAGEKLLALQLLKITGAGGRYNIGVSEFYSKWTKLIGVSRRTLQVYLGKLKALFSIGIKEGQYWIRTLVAGTKERTQTDTKCLKEHLSRVACRRNRATYTTKELEDTTNLISQYTDRAGSKIASIFLNAVRDSIKITNETERRKYKWNRTLKPKLVHQIIRNAIQNYAF